MGQIVETRIPSCSIRSKHILCTQSHELILLHKVTEYKTEQTHEKNI